MAGVASACAGRDALRLRRMMEAGHLFDFAAYAGTDGSKGLKQVLEDFAKIKNVKETATETVVDGTREVVRTSGASLIRYCCHPTRNFALGRRLELDNALADAGGDLTNLTLSKWFSWGPAAARNINKTDADYIIGSKSAATVKLVKSSVVELKNKLDNTTKALMHIKVGLAEKGYTVNKVVLKVPGGRGAIDAITAAKIEDAAEKAGVLIDFEGIVRMSPTP